VNFEEDEPAGSAPLDRALLDRLWSFLKPHRGVLALGIALLVAGRACEWVMPWFLQKAIDGPMLSSLHGTEGAALRSAAHALAGLAVAYLAIALGHAFIHYLQTTVLTRLGQAATLDVRRTLFRHVLRLPLGWYDKKPVGELVTRMTGDVENLVELFSTGAASLVLDPIWIVVVLATLFFLDVRLASITLVSLPVFGVVAFRFRERARLAYRDSRKAIARSNAFIQEAIAGMRVTQLTVQQRRMDSRFAEVAGVLRNAWVVTIHHFAVFISGVDFLTLLVQLVIFAVGMKFVRDGSMSTGQWFRVWIYVGYLFEPLRELAERWNVLQSALVSTERVGRILDEAPEPDGEVAHVPGGAIEFKDVHFAYGPGGDVISALDLKVRPGETVAFVGATGAGKTTVTQLLLRLYRRRTGSITVDGIDLDRLALASLRRGIGVVPQDVFLFADSILENVRLFEPTISEAAVRDACRTVGADAFIERLPRGYATPLGERGQNLSAGQRQLLAFARVLVHDPRVLILDEATSSVDTESERLLQRAVERVLAGRTCLVIAHRLSTIRRADQILVLHHGRLREHGTHAELLKLGGIYARLHALQFPDSPAA
jgi:ATP-binding cassette subfamily B multidrug efflux pump